MISIFQGRVSDRLLINAHFCVNLWIFDVIMIFGIGDEGKVLLIIASSKMILYILKKQEIIQLQ